MVVNLEVYLCHEVGVEGVDGDLQHQQPHDLGWRHLAQHRSKGDHCCAGSEGAVYQQWEVQLDERPARTASTARSANLLSL